MDRLNPVPLLAGLLIVVCAAGCTNQFDVSPDGKTLVETSTRQIFNRATGRSTDIAVLKFRSTSGGDHEVTIDIDDPHNPKFAPDGSLVAVEDGKDTLVVTKDGQKKFRVHGLVGPYAWRPDCSELFAIAGKLGEVIHIRSHEVVRRYVLPYVPDQALWLGDSRDIALAGKHRLTILSHGACKTIGTEGAIQLKAYDGARHRVIWSECFTVNTKNAVWLYGGLPTMDQPTNRDFCPRYELAIRAADAGVNRVFTLLQRTPTEDLAAAPTKYFIPIGVTVSPDGNQLAESGFEAVAKPGALERLEMLDRKLPNQWTSAERRERQELDGQVKLKAVCGVTALNGTGLLAKRVFERYLDKRDSMSDLVPLWASDDHRLKLLLDDKLIVL